MKQKYSLKAVSFLLFILASGLKITAQIANPLIHSTSFNGKGDEKHNDLLKGAVEDVSKRTPFSSTWTTKTGKVIAHYSSTIINYNDANGNLQPISTKLEPDGRGWVAAHQPNPCYFNSDRSTAIKMGWGREIVFNKNCTVNGMPLDQHIVSMENNDVKLDLSMGVHKEFTFLTNAVESAYTFDNPLEGGISVTEEFQIPAGFTIKQDGKNGVMKPGGWEGDYIIISDDGKEVLGSLQAALCYDSKKHWCYTDYSIEKRDGKNYLTTRIPADWLSTAVYPVVLDPLVIGATSYWNGGSTPSCIYPKFYIDSILVAIPGKITVPYFTIDYAYRSSTVFTDVIPVNDGICKFWTSCASTDTISCMHETGGGHGDTAGICFLEPYEDFHNPMTCCYAPSCSPQSFWLYAGLSRRHGGAGCDTSTIWYTKGFYTGFQYYFSAWLEGYTDSLISWSVNPASACSNNCSLQLKATAGYGVPPYTFTHPWASGKVNGGAYISCTSTGIVTMNLTIPKPCPYTCGNTDTITVPPPTVVDFCGDTATPGKSYKLIMNPVPVIKGDSLIKVCSGTPVVLNFTSCVSGTTFNWTGSDTTAGSGTDTLLTDNTKDTGKSTLIVHYLITGSYKGCNGDTLKATGYIYPDPNLNITYNPILELGSADSIKATGGSKYFWSPSGGLSCTNCANPVATPTITTTYYVTATDTDGCEVIRSIIITVLDDKIIVPNVISPNGDGINDFFVIQGLQDYPGSKLVIYDRWGKQIYSSSNYLNNWNGGGQSDGVYYYLLTLSNGKKFKGFVQLIK